MKFYAAWTVATPTSATGVAGGTTGMPAVVTDDVKKGEASTMASREDSQQFLGTSFDYMGVSKNKDTPKSSILIGFSIIFTIHFGVFPLFLETPNVVRC